MKTDKQKQNALNIRWWAWKDIKKQTKGLEQRWTDFVHICVKKKRGEKNTLDIIWQKNVSHKDCFPIITIYKFHLKNLFLKCIDLVLYTKHVMKSKVLTFANKEITIFYHVNRKCSKLLVKAYLNVLFWPTIQCLFILICFHKMTKMMTKFWIYVKRCFYESKFINPIMQWFLWNETTIDINRDIIKNGLLSTFFLKDYLCWIAYWECFVLSYLHKYSM